MNCCKNHDNSEEKNLTTGQLDAQTMHHYTNTQAPKHNHKGHMLHMLLCCGVPILLILLLPALGYKGFLLNIVPFICPIMMLVMMPMMMRGHGGCSEDSGHAKYKTIEEK